MFASTSDYPCAITDGDDRGLAAGFQWCAAHMEEGDSLTLFVPLKSSLQHSDFLRALSSYRDVNVVTSRGTSFISSSGPVLAVWPDMDDLGKITRSGNRVRALCVAAWVEDWVRPWVAATEAEILGDSHAWDDLLQPGLDPVVHEAMKSLTLTINHNNTISAGFEKDQVVGILLALHNAGYELDGETLQGWALANGWRGQNPQRLAKYAADINNGKRPRARSLIRHDYIDRLKRKAAGEDA